GPRPMRIRFGSASDIGKARDRNEDSYLAEPPVFAVADGMGGHKGGDVASSLAIQVLGDALPSDGAELVERVREANRAVYERSSSDTTVEGMGTTMTATIAGGGALRLAHVGDSRAYLLREGTLRRLTEDHTLVQRMVSEGHLTEEEASVHPQRSVITRVLGVEDRVQIDEGAVEVRDGDRILLCTDGLTGMVSEEEIETILKRAPDPQAAADQLVAAANEAGGLDNVTAVVLDIEVDAEEQRARDAETPADRAEAAGLEERLEGGGGRVPRWAIVTGVIVLLLIAGFFFGRAYVNDQWYVGVEEDQVAVFQGIPATVGGFDLHHVVQRTDLSATSAEQLAVWSSLSDGVTADNRAGAQAIVEQIRRDLAAKAAQNGGGGGTGAGSGTGIGSGTGSGSGGGGGGPGGGGSGSGSGSGGGNGGGGSGGGGGNP
ncbi:MAG TPA: Stp1/IreP family PP2C-type Ser/Thr phosphatase, partial [Actinomycetota bacterium]